MKKKLSFILALLIAISIAIPIAVFGAEPETGSIELHTIPENSFDGMTISAYQLFHISGSTKTGWEYTIHEDFEDFEYNGLSGLELIDHIYSLESEAAAHGSGIRSLTEALLAYIRANGIGSTGYVQPPENPSWHDPNITSAVIDGLPLGYYLVSGNVRATGFGTGAFMSISPFTALINTNNADSNLVLAPKTNTPYIHFNLAEGQSPLTGVGEVMSFVVETAVPLNIFSFDTYSFQLELSMGPDVLRLVPGSLEVRLETPDSLPIAAQGSYVLTDLSLAENEWGNSVYLNFTQNFLENNIGNKLYITFLATRVEDGVNMHDNRAVHATLFYSANDGLTGRVEASILLRNTTCYVYKFTGNLDAAHTPLGGETGARFAISHCPDAQTGTEVDEENLLVLVRNSEGRYTLALDQQSAIEGIRTKHMSPSSFGFIEILGLPLGTYYLYETSAPEGFSQLAAPQEILIESSEFGWGYTISPRVYVPNNGFIENEWRTSILSVAIQNNRSSLFPETGGIGTGIFLLIGTIIMTISATAMIIYRKYKKSNHEERATK